MAKSLMTVKFGGFNGSPGCCSHVYNSQFGNVGSSVEPIAWVARCLSPGTIFGISETNNPFERLWQPQWMQVMRNALPGHFPGQFCIFQSANPKTKLTWKINHK